MMVAVLVYSQTSKEEVDLFQSAFGMEKKALVASMMILDANQKDAFWALYDEYETTRKEYGKVRIELAAKYTRTSNVMTVEEVDRWIKDVMDLQTSTDKLIKKYYNKIKKETDVLVAAKFYQIENLFLTAINTEIQKEMPLIR